MKLIRALLDRLSENFVVSVSEKLELATEPSNNPPLRLVLDKPLLSVPVDTIPRRSAGHSVSHVGVLIHVGLKTVRQRLGGRDDA